MIEQVKEIASQLEGSGYNYRFDCGTLLGYVRENRLFESDMDVDITIFYNEEGDIQNLRARLVALGYSGSIFYYRGKPQSIRLEPLPSSKSRKPRAIDIKLFYIVGDFGYSSDFIFQASGFGHGKRDFSSFFRAVKKLAWRLLSYNRRRIEIDSQLRKFLLPITQEVCWRIPVGLSFETFLYDGWFRIPRQYQAYLTYRYGDWMTPDKNWNFRTHDPTYVYTGAEELIRQDLTATV